MNMHDVEVDTLLAEHRPLDDSAMYEGLADLEVPVDELTARDRARLRVAAETVAEKAQIQAQTLTGEPPTMWPANARHWTPELRALRRAWVWKLYHDEQLPLKEVARRMGSYISTLTADIRELDINRDGPSPHTPTRAPVTARRERVKQLYAEDAYTSVQLAGMLGVSESVIAEDFRALGIGYRRSRRKDQRREQVKELFENQGLGPREIAEQLRASTSTIQTDVREMRLTRRRGATSPKGLVELVDRATEQLDLMGSLLLDHNELHMLTVDEETRKIWEKRLTRVVRAISRVRKHMREENTQ